MDKLLELKELILDQIHQEMDGGKQVDDLVISFGDVQISLPMDADVFGAFEHFVNELNNL